MVIYILPLVDSYISYCNLVWSASHRTDSLDRILKIQKKYCRLVTISNYTATSRPLFQLLSILSVYDMHKYQLLIHIYRSTNSLTQIIIIIHFIIIFQISSIHQYCTRQQFNLHVPKCRTSLRQHTIVFQGPKLWNSLPLELRTSHSFNSFKRSLKSCFCLHDQFYHVLFHFTYSFYCIHMIVS